MSKIAKAITATFTQDVRASRKLGFRYTDVSVDYENSRFTQERRVTLGVNLHTSVYLNDRLSDPNNNTFSATTTALKRAMIEEIFGEFRSQLIELQAAIYSNDTERAKSIATDIEHKMFVEGL